MRKREFPGRVKAGRHLWFGDEIRPGDHVEFFGSLDIGTNHDSPPDILSHEKWREKEFTDVLFGEGGVDAVSENV